jgi:hypothetical protein
MSLERHGTKSTWCNTGLQNAYLLARDEAVECKYMHLIIEIPCDVSKHEELGPLLLFAAIGVGTNALPLKEFISILALPALQPM